MQLNFYQKRSTSSPTFKQHWFYYPKKEEPIIFPRDLPWQENAIWPIDFNKALEPVHVVELLKEAYYNGLTTNVNMFYPTYFFDPIHGYCTCNDIVNNYKKHIHKTGICDCMRKIEFHGKPSIFLVSMDEHIKANSEWGPFQKGFQRVLYVEPLVIFDCQMYLVCSVNVMDVKSIQENTYDIGLSYDFVYSIYTRSNFPKHPKVGLGHLKKIACEHFELDLKRYKEKCIDFIKEWIMNGFIPKDNYYVHIYTQTNNATWYEDRIYISETDYKSCVLHFDCKRNNQRKIK